MDFLWAFWGMCQESWSPLLRTWMLWKGVEGDCFLVREAYTLLHLFMPSSFSVKGIWAFGAPTKLAFYAREVSWGKVLTLDKLQRGVGISLIGVSFVTTMRRQFIICYSIVRFPNLWGSSFFPQWGFFGFCLEQSTKPFLVGEAIVAGSERGFGTPFCCA